MPRIVIQCEAGFGHQIQAIRDAVLDSRDEMKGLEVCGISDTFEREIQSSIELESAGHVTAHQKGEVETSKVLGPVASSLMEPARWPALTSVSDFAPLLKSVTGFSGPPLTE